MTGKYPPPDELYFKEDIETLINCIIVSMLSFNDNEQVYNIMKNLSEFVIYKAKEL
jgi:hypothetical protein